MTQKKPYLTNWQQNFLPYFGKQYQENLSFRKLFCVSEIATILIGLISYKSVCDAKFKYKNSIEWKLFVCPVVILVSNEVFFVNTMIKKFQQDVTEALAILPLLLTGLLLSVQGVRFYFWKNEIQSLMGHLKSSWSRELKLGISDEVANNAKWSISLTKYYVVVIILPITSYVLRPVIAFAFHNKLHGNDSFMSVKVLPGNYPFAVDSTMTYVLCNIWEGLVVIIAGICWIASDTAFFQCAAVVSLHFQSIGDKLRNVVKKCDLTKNDIRLINQLTEIGKQHSHVLRLCRRMERLFNPGIFSVMLYTSVSLCVCLINIENSLSERHFMNALKFLLYFFCVLVQTAAYCHATDNVSHWSKMIAQAGADCQWIDHSSKFNRILMLIIVRAQKYYEFKAYGFYTVNKIQLARIITLAINLFTLMRSARNYALS